MQETIRASPAPHKDRFTPQIGPLKPGAELVDRIRWAHMPPAGRPAWRLGVCPGEMRSLLAPRLTRVACVDEDGAPGWANPTPGSGAVRHRVRLVLDTDHELAREHLRAHDHSDMIRVWAAAMHDIRGASYAAIAEHSGAPAGSDYRVTRRAVERGRIILRELSAWPWSYFDAKGRPPTGWREGGASPALRAAFLSWEADTPVLARDLLGPSEPGRATS